MNCFYHKIKQCKAYRLLTMAIVGVVATSASAEVVDLGELQFDKAYEITTSDTYTGYVVAPKNGTITYTNKNVSFSAYLDANHETAVEGSNGSWTDEGYQASFSAKQGTTYYFYCDNWLNNSGTFTVSMNTALSLKSATVAEGGNLTVGGNGNVEYIFNQSIAVSGVTLKAGTNIKTLTADDTYRVSGARLTVEYASVLNEWYNNGTVKKGDAVTISVTGLCSASDAKLLYNDNGEATFSYVAAEKPVTLVSATTADGKGTLVNGNYADVKFLSYFRTDNESGKYVFTFSDAIDATGDKEKYAYLIWGENSEGGDVYQEWVPVTFSNDNKTITVDCTGVTRSVEKMSPETKTNYGYIILKLTGIKSTEGQYAYTGSNANQGTYSFALYYDEVEAPVGVQFMPEDTFDDEEELTITITNYTNITFSGVKFAWKAYGTQNEVVVAKDDINIQTASNAARLKVTIPEAARTAKNVTVSFVDLVVNDGSDQNALFTALYNAAEYAVSTDLEYESNPANGETVEELSSIMINFTGHNYVYYNEGKASVVTRFSYIGELPAPTQGKLASTMAQSLNGLTADDDVYTVTFPKGYFIFEDNTISDEFSITVIVSNEEQGGDDNENSTVNITSTPANGSTVASCESIDIIFNDYEEIGVGSGKATISKDGGEAVNLGDTNLDWDIWNKAIQPLDGAAAENGTYVVTFPAGYFLGGEDGEEIPEFTITFTVGTESSNESKVNITSTPANGSTVASCESIDIIFNDYEEIGVGSGKATISKDGGEAVNLGDTNLDWDIWNKAIQPLDGAAAENGTYVVTFPAGYFLGGEDGEEIPAFTITFTVDSAAGVSSIAADSEGTTEYYDLKGVKVSTPDKGVYVVKRGNSVSKVVVK